MTADFRFCISVRTVNSKGLEFGIFSHSPPCQGALELGIGNVAEFPIPILIPGIWNWEWSSWEYLAVHNTPDSVLKILRGYRYGYKNIFCAIFYLARVNKTRPKLLLPREIWPKINFNPTGETVGTYITRKEVEGYPYGPKKSSDPYLDKRG